MIKKINRPAALVYLLICSSVCQNVCFQEQQRLKALDEEFHRKLAVEMKKVILVRVSISS